MSSWCHPAVHRLAVEVLQRVVHPTHVPLEVEAEAVAVRRRAGHAGPRGGLLGERRRAGELLGDGARQLAKEVECLEVLASAVAVGDPFPRLPGVVEVEHRGDGVDAEAVGVVALEPRDRAGHEECPHLRPPVVEDRRAPVRVEPLARIGVLVEVGAVEAGQPVGVHREVRGHPVHDHPDAALVEPIDHRHQAGGSAVARRRREVARGLVAPRAVERVLHHREQLDVGEPVGRGVVGERVGQLLVAREAAPWRDVAAPRPEVDLVDRHRGPGGQSSAAGSHPPVVAPRVGQVGDHRRRRRRLRGGGGHGVGLLQPVPAVGGDRVPVRLPGPGTGDVGRPQPRAGDGLQQVLVVPTGEVTDHRDAGGVGRPHREPRPGRVGMGAEEAMDVTVGALVEQVEVDLAGRPGHGSTPNRCERVSAGRTVASDEAPAEERLPTACVAGERHDGLRGRGTQ